MDDDSFLTTQALNKRWTETCNSNAYTPNIAAHNIFLVSPEAVSNKRFIYLVDDTNSNPSVAGAGTEIIKSDFGNVLKIHFFFTTQKTDYSNNDLLLRLFHEIIEDRKGSIYTAIITPLPENMTGNPLISDLLSQSTPVEDDKTSKVSWYRIPRVGFEQSRTKHFLENKR